MPTYDYRCEACKHEFEEVQSFKDEPLKKCPQCKKNKLRRLIGTGSGILFRGSGFYITDYRSESYKSAAKADQEASKASTSKTESNGTTASKDTGQKSSSNSSKTAT